MIHLQAASTPPVLISVAPNGAKLGKRDHPAIPLTPAELAAEARACRAAGAGLLHMHVRDAFGHHSLAPDDFRPAIAAVSDAVGDDMILQITTEAGGRYTASEQMCAVKAISPAAASFALRELVPNLESEAEGRDFFAYVADSGILPQFILYDIADAARLHDLIHRGVVPFVQPPVLFVLGRYEGGLSSHPAMITSFLEAWGVDGHWTVCAFGPAEIAVAAAALALGGHARVGFENNLQRPDGNPLSSNAEQVGRVACLADLLGRRRQSGLPTSLLRLAI